MPHCCGSECINRHERTPKRAFYKIPLDDKTKQKDLKVVKADAKSDLFYLSTENNLSQIVNIFQVPKHPWANM